MKLLQFLIGLNGVYKPIWSSLLPRETLPNVKDAFAIISKEESHRGISSSFSFVPKSQTTSFVFRTNFSNNTNNKNKRFDNRRVNSFGNRSVKTSGNNRGPNLNLSYKNYGKVGHTIERCFDIIGYPPGLGHPSDQVIVVLQDELQVSKQPHVSPCDICHKAKQLREPFPLIDHKIVAVGDPIHIDRWGPYKVTSREGFRYFLTIVDDYSKGVWSEDDFATSMGDTNTFFEGHVGKNPTNSRLESIPFDFNSPRMSNENMIDEQQPQPNTRRSSRPTKMPAKFNDCVVHSSHKYGLEKHVNYSNLTMNNELEALHRNNTWTITHLPVGRKAIGSK
ncbi:hypothetical protein Tco_0917068 [Tanacetum coccineum]